MEELLEEFVKNLQKSFSMETMGEFPLKLLVERMRNPEEISEGNPMNLAEIPTELLNKLSMELQEVFPMKILGWHLMKHLEKFS